MEVRKQIESRLAYLGWTHERLAIKARMSKATLNRRLRDPGSIRLDESHRIEKALGLERGALGRM